MEKLNNFGCISELHDKYEHDPAVYMYRLGTHNVYIYLFCVINHILNIAKNSNNQSGENSTRSLILWLKEIVSISFDYYEDQSLIMKPLTRYQIHPGNLFFLWLTKLPIIKLINYDKKVN